MIVHPKETSFASQMKYSEIALASASSDMDISKVMLFLVNCVFIFFSPVSRFLAAFLAPNLYRPIVGCADGQKFGLPSVLLSLQRHLPQFVLSQSERGLRPTFYRTMWLWRGPEGYLLD